MAGTVFGVAFALWAVGWLWVRRFLRRRIARIEYDSGEISERVHRLQRLGLWNLAGLLVGIVATSGALSGAADAVAHAATAQRTAVTVLGIVSLLVVLGVGIELAHRVGRATRRVRGVPPKRANSGREWIAVLVPSLLIGLLVGFGFSAVPDGGVGRVVGRGIVYFAALFLLATIVSPLLVARVRARPLDPDTRLRFEQLARDAGVHIRDFRLLPMRDRKVANAMQMGVLPGFRYVVVTDYLLDNVDRAAVDAVVAHELGHARRHHIAVKLGAVVVVWVVLQSAFAALDAHHGLGATLGIIPVALAFPIGLIAVQGLVGIRLEQAADEAAVRQVGAAELARALRRIGELNHTKRDTGRVWSVLTQHPGLDARLRRLADSEPADARA